MGDLVVIKGETKYTPDPTSLTRFQNDINLRKEVSHSGICTLHGAWTDFDLGSEIFPSVVLEYLPIKFTDVITKPSKYNITVGKMLDILLDLATVLVSLHEKGFQYNNFKPSHVMLTRELNPKLTRFGPGGHQHARYTVWFHFLVD